MTTGDRQIQDQIIRALADASFRLSDEWLSLDLADAERVARFSRFLARNYYHQRLIHFFKYSRALRSLIGRSADELVEMPDFKRSLATVTLGSKASAENVCAQAVRFVCASPRAKMVPYLEELLAYESTMMVIEAGPKTRQDAIDRQTVETVRKTFAFDLPSVLPLLTGVVNKVPAVGSGPISLLFTRDQHARVTVLKED